MCARKRAFWCSSPLTQLFAPPTLTINTQLATMGAGARFFATAAPAAKPAERKGSTYKGKVRVNVSTHSALVHKHCEQCGGSLHRIASLHDSFHLVEIDDLN